MHPDLVPRAFDPLDAVDVQEHEPLAVADDEPRRARSGRSRACRRAKRLQQCLEPTCRRPLAFLCDYAFLAMHSISTAMPPGSAPA